MELRRVDRLLQVHPVHDVVQEERQGPLILLVTAGSAEREIRIAAALRIDPPPGLDESSFAVGSCLVLDGGYTAK